MNNLVFLSIYGPAAIRLKRTRVPIQDSIAGTVFSTKKPYVTADAHKDKRFFDKVDRRSNYITEDMLTFPLIYSGKPIGVLQFLNKKGSSRFDSGDYPTVNSFLPSLTKKTESFISNIENFDILGLTLDQEPDDATILFVDMTNSSLLFDTMESSFAIELINSYLELVCDVAFKNNATIDQTMGDGIMVAFNIPRHLIDYELEALKTALEIQEAFEDLKIRWQNSGHQVDQIYSRIGISTGPVHRLPMGHPQYERITLMGQVVNIASNLCEAGSRTENTIVIDSNIYSRLSDRCNAEFLTEEELGKAGRLVSAAYKLVNIEFDKSV